MSRPSNRFQIGNDLNLQGRTLVGTNHMWQGDDMQSGTVVPGVSAAYTEGDVVIYNGHIYVANALDANVPNDNIVPGSDEDTAYNSNAGAWTLISGGGVSPTTLPSPFRQATLDGITADGDYELQRTTTGGTTTYSWVLAGSTAGATDVQSIVVPGVTVNDTVTLQNTDAIDYNMSQDQTLIQFSTTTDANLFLTPGRYTVADPNSADPNNPDFIVQNPFTFQRESSDGTPVTETIPEGTIISGVTVSATIVVFHGIDLESLSPTSSTDLTLDVLLDNSLSGHVGFESSDGRILLSRNGNTIDFTIPGFPVPNVDGVVANEVIDTLSFGDHHYRVTRVIPNLPVSSTARTLTSLEIDGENFQLADSGASTFLELTDTPDTYPAFNPNQVMVPRVVTNQAGTTELEFNDINDFLDESLPETIDMGFNGRSSGENTAHPHLIEFTPPDGWDEFGRLGTVTLENIPSFNRNGFLGDQMNGVWEEVQTDTGGAVRFALNNFAQSGITNNRVIHIVEAPDPQPANPDTQTYGVTYQKRVGNSTYYLVGFNSDSIGSINRLLGTWTLVDAGGTKSFSRWHTTDISNIRRRWLVLRNIHGNSLAASGNLASDGWVVLSDSYVSFTGGGGLSPFQGPEGQSFFVIGANAEAQVIDHALPTNSDFVSESQGWNIDYGTATRSYVHVPNPTATDGGQNIIIGGDVPTSTRMATLPNANINTPVRASFQWRAASTAALPTHSGGTDRRNFIFDVADYTNSHTSSISAQHISSGNIHFALLTGSTVHSSHEGLHLRLALHGLLGGSSSRAKSGFRRTNNDNNPMWYLNDPQAIWVLSNVQDKQGNTWNVVVRRTRNLPRVAFGNFNTSSGADCGYEYPLDIITGWRTHTRTSPWSADPLTYEQASRLHTDTNRYILGIDPNITAVQQLNASRLSTTGIWSTQTNRQFTQTLDGYTNFAMHEPRRLGNVPDTYTFSDSDNPNYWSPEISSASNGTNFDIPTVLPRFSANIFGFDPDEDLLENDITDITLNVTQRRVGGYACDAPEGALDAIGSSIVNELNNLDETVPTYTTRVAIDAETVAGLTPSSFIFSTRNQTGHPALSDNAAMRQFWFELTGQRIADDTPIDTEFTFTNTESITFYLQGPTQEFTFGPGEILFGYGVGQSSYANDPNNAAAGLTHVDEVTMQSPGAVNNNLNTLGNIFENNVRSFSISEAVSNDISPAYEPGRSDLEHWSYSVVPATRTTVPNPADTTQTFTPSACKLIFATDNPPSQVEDTATMTFQEAYQGLDITSFTYLNDSTTNYTMNAAGPTSVGDGNSEVTETGNFSTIRDTLEVVYSPYNANIVEYFNNTSYTAGQRVRAPRDDGAAGSFLYTATTAIPSNNTTPPASNNSNWRRDSLIFTQDFPDFNNDWDSGNLATRIVALDEMLFGLQYDNTIYTSQNRHQSIVFDAGTTVGQTQTSTLTFYFDTSGEANTFLGFFNVDGSNNPTTDVLVNWNAVESMTFPASTDYTVTAMTPATGLSTVVLTTTESTIRQSWTAVPVSSRGSDVLLAIGSTNQFSNVFTANVDDFGNTITIRSRITERHPIIATTRIISGPSVGTDQRASGSTLNFDGGAATIYAGRSNSHTNIALLENLNDVSVSNATIEDGQTLVYRAGVWENEDVGIELVDITKRENTNIVDITADDIGNNIDVNRVIEVGAAEQELEVEQVGDLSPVGGGNAVIARWRLNDPTNYGLDRAGGAGGGFGTSNRRIGFAVVLSAQGNPDGANDLIAETIANHPFQSTRRGVVDELVTNLELALTDAGFDPTEAAVEVEHTTDFSEIRVVYSGTIPTGDTLRMVQLEPTVSPDLDLTTVTSQSLQSFASTFTIDITNGQFETFGQGYFFEQDQLSGPGRDQAFSRTAAAAAGAAVIWELFPQRQIGVNQFEDLDPLGETITVPATAVVPSIDVTTGFIDGVNTIWDQFGYSAELSDTPNIAILTGPLGTSFRLQSTVIAAAAGFSTTSTRTRSAAATADFAVQPTVNGNPILSLDFTDATAGSRLRVNPDATGLEVDRPFILNNVLSQIPYLPVVDTDGSQEIFRATHALTPVVDTIPSSNLFGVTGIINSGNLRRLSFTIPTQNAAQAAAGPSDPFFGPDHYIHTFERVITQNATIVLDGELISTFGVGQVDRGQRLLFLAADRDAAAGGLVRTSFGAIISYALEVRQVWDPVTGVSLNPNLQVSGQAVQRPGTIVRSYTSVVAEQLFSTSTVDGLTNNQDYVLSLDTNGNATWATAPADPETWAADGNADPIPESKIPADIARDSELPTGTVTFTGEITGTLTPSATDQSVALTVSSDIARDSEVAVKTVTESDGTNSSLLQLAADGTLSNRAIEMRDLPNIQYGDVVTFTDEAARNASTVNIWHQGDIAILTTPDPDQVYLYVGTNQTTGAATVNTDWHLITPTSGAVTMSQLNNFALRTTHSLGDIFINAINNNVDENGNAVATTIRLDADTITRDIARTADLPDGAITFTGDVTGTVTPGTAAQDVALTLSALDDSDIPSGIARDSEVALRVNNGAIELESSITGADDAARQAAIRTAIGAGASSFEASDQFIRSVANNDPLLSVNANGQLSSSPFIPYSLEYDVGGVIGSTAILGRRSVYLTGSVLPTATVLFGTEPGGNEFTVFSSTNSILYWRTTNLNRGLFSIQVTGFLGSAGDLAIVRGTAASVPTANLLTTETSQSGDANHWVNMSTTMALGSSTAAGVYDGFALAWNGANGGLLPSRLIVKVTRLG